MAWTCYYNRFRLCSGLKTGVFGIRCKSSSASVLRRVAVPGGLVDSVPLEQDFTLIREQIKSQCRAKAERELLIQKTVEDYESRARVDPRSCRIPFLEGQAKMVALLQALSESHMKLYKEGAVNFPFAIPRSLMGTLPVYAHSHFSNRAAERELTVIYFAIGDIDEFVRVLQLEMPFTLVEKEKRFGGHQISILGFQYRNQVIRLVEQWGL